MMTRRSSEGLVFLLCLSFLLTEARASRHLQDLNTTGFQVLDVSYLWKMYRKESESLDSATQMVQNTVEAWLDDITTESNVDDKIVVNSFESAYERECGESTSPYPNFPVCVIVKTSVDALLSADAFDLEDETAELFLLQKIKQLIPDINQDQSIVRAEFEYPISIGAKFLITLDGADRSMDVLQTATFNLVLEEQLTPVMLDSDPPFEFKDVIIITQQTGTADNRRRRALAEHNLLDGYTRSLQDGMIIGPNTYNKISIMVKSNCGDKSKCTNDNLEEFLVGETKDVVSTKEFQNLLVERESLLGTILNIDECNGNSDCAKEKVDELVTEIRKSEDTGMAIVNESLREFVTNILIVEGTEGISAEQVKDLTPEEIEDLAVAFELEIKNEIARKNAAGQLQSYFLGFDGVQVSDSKSGFLPPINIPSAQQMTEASNEASVSTGVSIWTWILVAVITAIVAVSFCFAHMRSPKRRKLSGGRGQSKKLTAKEERKARLRGDNGQLGHKVSDNRGLSDDALSPSSGSKEHPEDKNAETIILDPSQNKKLTAEEEDSNLGEKEERKARLRSDDGQLGHSVTDNRDLSVVALSPSYDYERFEV